MTSHDQRCPLKVVGGDGGGDDTLYGGAGYDTHAGGCETKNKIP